MSLVTSPVISQNRLKQLAKKIVRKTPIISDYYHYYWDFTNRTTACRGVFNTFTEAIHSLPPGSRVGYNPSDIHDHSSIGKLTSGWEIGEFNSGDYPILLWLQSALADGSTIFDLGGNLGQAYYAYKKYLQYPQDLKWVVCDLPEIVKAGEKLAEKNDSSGLSFTVEFSDVEGANILLTNGTLQYLEPSCAGLLEQLKIKPKHILINQLPLYEGESFITLQNIGYAYVPYKIQNRAEFIRSLNALSYELIDSWHDYRTCSIPFHPERFVSGYHGFYFRFLGEEVKIK